MKGIGGLVLGRERFDMELSFGPWAYGAMPSVIMTNRPLDATPDNMRIAKGDPTPPLEALKARVRHADIWLLGGGVLAGQLLKAGQIDRVELTVLPIALGRGRALFGREEYRCVFDRVETRADGGSTTIVLAPRRRAP